MGMDSQKKETPFSKFWKAVHRDKNQKNSFASRMILQLALLKPDDSVTWGEAKNYLINFE